MPTPHDLGYRSLFAHPELVRELITDFTSVKLLDEIPLSAFERVNPAYVSEHLSARQDDIVWRVRLGDEFLYVYILIECQSGVDRWTALRMQTYIGLLYQDLVKGHKLSPGLLLPPVLPLVFYNGVPRWSASLELAGLLMQAPAELAALQPSQRYVLIDQQRLDKMALEANAGLLALLFRLELSLVPDVLQNVLPALTTWLKETPQANLRRSVQVWINALLERGASKEDLFMVDSVEEDGDMGGKLASWAEQLKEIGFQEGSAEGTAKGQVMALRGVLGSLLRNRFGELPAPATQRIAQATQAELERWIERILNAPSLQAVFDDGTPSM
ncbi:Rpn family recombination-promoting nuclease/putative transposase [Massilia antarctica]|uniref:Rpn family recombination-promoting nuclease/putative transposase n=1 Tax=Massilia antarctica TaxID=2765360 RepID=UPI0006BB62C5|nr:Rpn family recombination-promoting nuclease/putative transposase [Massilia sp. H27-R4]MCY0910584.1 Rpn family recombination-promoting nuclease/putative transposase [Massilia sp. H27-R4]CUI09052.1 putative transposase [Janthinobacterium sp. CG23_2]CUU32838.1 putative transposase [Janthinobacterium sp. CG23_2]